MIENKSVTAVLLAAGSSTRFGSGDNKNFVPLCGKPVLAYSIEVFARCPQVDELLVAVKEEEQVSAETLLAQCHIAKPARVVVGGSTRQQSVQQCLEASQSDYVIIHDGARPLVRQSFIADCLGALAQCRGVTVGVLSKDTVKVTDEQGFVLSTTRRSNTWLIQTPQAFHRTCLLELHRQYGSDDSITDDCMLLERGGVEVRVLPGHESNIKITTGDDLERVRLWLEQGAGQTGTKTIESAVNKI